MPSKNSGGNRPGLKSRRPTRGEAHRCHKGRVGVSFAWLKPPEKAAVVKTRAASSEFE